jgi:hypothetical protein
MTAAMGREHYALVEALRSAEEPEFTNIVRKTHTAFALRWIGSGAHTPSNADAETATRSE